MANYVISDKPTKADPDDGDWVLVELAGQPGVYRKIQFGDLRNADTVGIGLLVGTAGNVQDDAASVYTTPTLLIGNEGLT
jgi:hypothetical protein